MDPASGRVLPPVSGSGAVDASEPRLTAIMLAHKTARLADGVDVLRKYTQEASDVFARFIFIWNDPNSHPFSTPSSKAAKALVRLTAAAAPRVAVSLFETAVNSMNNRFAVWPHIRTAGVFIQDDDMWLDEAHLRCLHQLWLKQPHALVGAAAERTDFLYPNPQARNGATRAETDGHARA